MSKIQSPDEWAASTQQRTGGWADLVPDEVRDQLRDTKLGQVLLAQWFRDVVAPAYPDEDWPKKATRSKVKGLMDVIRAES